ncbi:MAG: CapA family protein [Desulfuromonadaceae bacterium]|nr:CapA family protein [Desulfuromonas sp.]MDY0185184.1 CapA family protein [Desulfuromonadaceae bacterium]
MGKKDTLRIAAVGDLLLTTPRSSRTPGRGLEALSPEICNLFATCDVVLANLECTLPAEPYISTEPRVFTTEQQLESLQHTHINLVTLANNHAFDAFDPGFEKIETKLNQLGIKFFGAGLDSAKACAPITLSINDIRIAFFAAVSPSTGVKRFASAEQSGVPPFDDNVIRATINGLKQTHDHVFFVPHWGDERFRFPAPKQIIQARCFIDSGATAILGHHPHVLQGTEHYQHGFIAYSLGNFLANCVYWEDGDTLSWDRFERTSSIIVLELDKKQIRHVETFPVLDTGHDIILDRSRRGEKYRNSANKLLRKGITVPQYNRESYRVRAMLPIVKKATWENMRRIRPAHFKKIVRLLLNKS